MTERLDAKQVTPLTSGERAAIHKVAKERGITAGLFSRALLLHALDEALGSQGLDDRIEAEKAASKQRISEGARAAVNARYGNAEGEDQ